MRILIRFINLLPVLLGVMLTCSLQAQSERSAVMTVLGDTVTLQRGGTHTPLPLSDGAIAPIGTGDIIVTGNHGRAFIDFESAYRLYLVPNTRYQLQVYSKDQARYLVQGSLHGVAIQHTIGEHSAWQYRLSTSAFTVTQPANLFVIWALEGYLEAAISAAGNLTLQIDDRRVTLTDETGILPRYGQTPLSLEAPYAVTQLLEGSIFCEGIVETNGSIGLQLRMGAALDYGIVQILQDGYQLQIVATTENGLWYGVPFQSKLGWVYSALVDANCQNLPVFPNLVGNKRKNILKIRNEELEFLNPFFGPPAKQPIFYR